MHVLDNFGLIPGPLPLDCAASDRKLGKGLQGKEAISAWAVKTGPTHVLDNLVVEVSTSGSMILHTERSC